MTDSSNTRCERAESVAAYVLRATPVGDRAEIEAHIEACVACRRDLAELRPIVDAFVDWPTDILRPTTPLWGRLEAKLALEPGDEPIADAGEQWAGEPAWKDVAPGISCKLLATDTSTDMVSMLVRLAPDTAYPPHLHAGVEELFLLDGELWIEDRKLLPGDYNRGEPGTEDHRVWSETGCTCVLLTSYRDILR
jgi:hypothetical protein